MSPQCCRVLGNVLLSTGCHYWKIKIDQFSGANHNGYVTVGVARHGDTEGRPLGKLVVLTYVTRYLVKEIKGS